ncbi:glycosyltransferase family 4 protein [Methylothermus subterraneus]
MLAQPPYPHPSGGCRYNRALLEQARRRGLPLRLWSWRAGERPPPADVLFWDSLGLPALVEQPLPQGTIHVLLLHYLPSLDPGLSTAQRLAWERLEEQVLARFTHVLLTGPGLGEALRWRFDRWIWLCEPGVEEAFFAAPKRPAFSPAGLELVTVANLLPAKGHLELLEVLAGLRRYPWRWHWVGSGAVDPEHALKLRRKIRALGLGGRVIHHGALAAARLIRLLDAADWFLFPSRFESFGMALAEAAARRVPAISSRVGAAERWVIPGRTGWLLEPGDLSGFAKALARCLSAPKPKRVWQQGYLGLPPPPDSAQAFERFWGICLKLSRLGQGRPT